MDPAAPNKPYRGRGAVSNRVSRFTEHQRERFDDGWQLDQDATDIPTTLHIDSARTIISRNDSPDVPFNRSINPYAELKEIFSEWLTAHYPDRASKVLNLLRQCRGGQLNDPGFGSRMRGSGPIADLIGQRFALAARRLGLGTPSESWELTTKRFRIAQHPGGQMTLAL